MCVIRITMFPVSTFASRIVFIMIMAMWLQSVRKLFAVYRGFQMSIELLFAFNVFRKISATEYPTR
jgi:hypothetical protein